MQLRNFLKQKQKIEKIFNQREFKTFKMVYSLQATVATRDYHVYKNITRDQTKVGDKVLVLVKTESDKK